MGLITIDTISLSNDNKRYSSIEKGKYRSKKCNIRYEMFENEETNNKIIFEEIRYDDEEKLKDIIDMLNMMPEEKYKYLCNQFKNNENMCVVISQSYETTSNYVIIEDCKKDTYKKIIKMLSKPSQYKYSIFKDNNYIKIEI